MEKIVEARALLKKYQEKAVVNKIRLDIYRGECFGILGPNGAGKSTTLKMIYGATIPTEGDLFINGLNVVSDILRVKSRMGVVPQEDGLDPDFSVLDNLLVYASFFRIPPKLAKTRARELLRFMHLDEYDDRPVEHLSGGMKRRLAIARALLSEPEFLVLDEPTTGLDPQARQWIWDSLTSLKERGKTLILTTHYMEEAEQLCDRIIIMDKGEILAEGTPKDLIRKHVGREVVEFRVESEDVEYHLQQVRKKFDYQVLNNRIRVFVPLNMEGREIIASISTPNIEVRPARLDDVFIKLAGYELGKEG
jgi:lipooligosaccharide transport system ATP-binding protein